MDEDKLISRPSGVLVFYDLSASKLSFASLIGGLTLRPCHWPPGGGSNPDLWCFIWRRMLN